LSFGPSEGATSDEKWFKSEFPFGLANVSPIFTRLCHIILTSLNSHLKAIYFSKPHGILNRWTLAVRKSLVPEWVTVVF